MLELRNGDRWSFTAKCFLLKIEYGQSGVRHRPPVATIHRREHNVKIVSPVDEPGGSGRGGSTFTGEVFTYVTMEYTDGAAVTNVCFTPGARTFWHSHENGQILLVLAGKGWTQSDGQSKQVIRAGDTVWVPAGELHWHGATNQSYMTHKAISLGNTAWSQAVSDADYQQDVS